MGLTLLRLHFGPGWRSVLDRITARHDGYVISVWVNGDQLDVYRVNV